MTKTAPGVRVAAAPRGNPILNLLKFGPDPLEFMTKLAQTAELGIVPVRIGNVTLRLVTDPALIKRALELDDPPTLGRGRFTRVASWYREGIFVITSGPEHARQRDVLGRPIWNDPRTPEIAQRRATAMAAGWREGEPVDLWRTFRRLHFETDWEQLTGEQADEPLLHAFETGDVWQPRLIQPLGTLLWRLPTGSGARKASALIDGRVDALVAQRRRAPDDAAADQLSRLVRQAADDGGVTTDEQLRATVKLQFPDPIHDFLTWIFWALARNPVVEERWLEEIDRELAGAPPTPADVGRLPYVHRVLLETMRLYPPAFGIFREALQDLDVDGHAVPAGDVVVMSQWITHRDPRLWDDVLRFDPERWAEGVPRPPELTYFPFSAGPHSCHGSQQALREATVVAATVSQRWRLRAESDKEPALALGIGLQPKRPLRLVPVARST